MNRSNASVNDFSPDPSPAYSSRQELHCALIHCQFSLLMNLLQPYCGGPSTQLPPSPQPNDSHIAAHTNAPEHEMLASFSSGRFDDAGERAPTCRGTAVTGSRRSRRLGARSGVAGSSVGEVYSLAVAAIGGLAVAAIPTFDGKTTERIKSAIGTGHLI